MSAMNSPRYVHLRLHSEYSVTDGIVRVGDAVKRAASDGMPALAMTDLGNLFGLVKKLDEEAEAELLAAERALPTQPATR